jgi:uncharacterized repeat protein (TIGR01451 family)
MSRGAGIKVPWVVPIAALLLMLFSLSASGSQPSLDEGNQSSCVDCGPLSNASAENANILMLPLGGIENAIADLNILRPAEITFNLQKSSPSAKPQKIITGNDTARTILLKSNDESNDKLRYKIVAAPSHGSLRGTAPKIVYVPAKGYSGDDSFTFSAVDESGTKRTVKVAIDVVSLYHPPDVIISSPKNGMIFTEDANTFVASVTVHAITSGDIASVTFYDNLDPVATVDAAPFEFTYDPYQGSHTLTAEATDSYGMTATSLPVVIIVNPPEPRVKITSPANGQIFTAPADIPIIAEVSNSCPEDFTIDASDFDPADNCCPVDNCCPMNVEFFANSQSLGVVKAPPYKFDWTDVLPGIYHLIAKAVDVDDNSAISETALTIVVPVNPRSMSNLVMTMSSSPTSVRKGSNFNYVLTVTNRGPDSATDVFVSDMLPEEVKYKSSKASQGSYDSSSGTWDLGGLAKYHSARLVITVKVPDTAKLGQITNTADVAGAENDPDDSSNHASAITSIKK